MVCSEVCGPDEATSETGFDDVVDEGVVSCAELSVCDTTNCQLGSVACASCPLAKFCQNLETLDLLNEAVTDEHEEASSLITEAVLVNQLFDERLNVVGVERVEQFDDGGSSIASVRLTETDKTSPSVDPIFVDEPLINLMDWVIQTSNVQTEVAIETAHDESQVASVASYHEGIATMTYDELPVDKVDLAESLDSAEVEVYPRNTTAQTEVLELIDLSATEKVGGYTEIIDEPPVKEECEAKVLDMTCRDPIELIVPVNQAPIFVSEGIVDIPNSKQEELLTIEPVVTGPEIEVAISSNTEQLPPRDNGANFDLLDHQNLLSKQPDVKADLESIIRLDLESEFDFVEAEVSPEDLESFVDLTLPIAVSVAQQVDDLAAQHFIQPTVSNKEILSEADAMPDQLNDILFDLYRTASVTSGGAVSIEFLQKILALLTFREVDRSSV